MNNFKTEIRDDIDNFRIEIKQYVANQINSLELKLTIKLGIIMTIGINILSYIPKIP